MSKHTITIWDSADSHYKEYVTDECLIDECPLEEHDKQIRTDAIEEFYRICEEARRHKFGVCDADFVIDVIKAKVKEQLKEQK